MSYSAIYIYINFQKPPIKNPRSATISPVRVAKEVRPSLGMRRLCQHNFKHNGYVWQSGIMLAFWGDYKALTVGKSADCTISLKKIEIL